VRVTIQLIDARNDLHVWANNFERELVNEFATQSEIVAEISHSTHLQLQPETAQAVKWMPRL
jgi:TolB-like protein|tara:strand:- start:3875 stop:4060 length:186 start_codon:yes stop_codon:yes gene_type:complete